MKINDILKKNKITSSNIKTLIDICFESEAFSYIKVIAEKTASEGQEKLGVLQPSKAKDVLKMMMNRVSNDISEMIHEF